MEGHASFEMRMSRVQVEPGDSLVQLHFEANPPSEAAVREYYAAPEPEFRQGDELRVGVQGDVGVPRAGAEEVGRVDTCVDAHLQAIPGQYVWSRGSKSLVSS